MKALIWALGILFLLVNHAMGGSKDKMQECKCPKEFLKDAMQMKIKLEWECKMQQWKLS